MSQPTSSHARGFYDKLDKLVYEARATQMATSKLADSKCKLCGLTAQKGEGEDVDTGGLQRCSGCRKVMYCSLSCQKQDWKRHKKDCKAHQAQNPQGSTSLPPEPVLRLMLHDFVNLHQRALSLVIGHHLFSTRGDAFPPMDIKNDWVLFNVKLRDPSASPASTFEITNGIAPLPIAGMSVKSRRQLEAFAEGLAKKVDLEEKINAGWSVVPAMFLVDNMSLGVCMVGVEITRSHLDSALLAPRSVPTGTPWWEQLEYNAQRGLVSLILWNEALQKFVMEVGTMKQSSKDDDWHWEKSEDDEEGQIIGIITREGNKLIREAKGEASS